MRRLLLSIGLAAGLSSSAGAQLFCEVNTAASCNVTGFTIAVTVTQASRLIIPSSMVSLPAPGDVEFAAGFGLPGALTYEVRSNTAWTVTLRGNAATWTGTPGSARQNKPVGDMQWATSASGPYTDLTQVSTSFASGGASAGTFQTLFLRPKLNWLVDAAGTYSLDVLLTITSP